MRLWPDLHARKERRLQRLQRNITSLERDLGIAGSSRSGTQEWIDAFLGAQEAGLLRTSMANLDEEQVVGSLSGVAKTNGPVFALMLARLQVFSQARFQWTRFVRGEPGDLFGSPELSVLERPWPGGTTADLLARMEMDVTSAGNCYIRRVRRRATGEDRLVRLRPDWVRILMGSREDADHPSEAPDVELLGYAYMPSDGAQERMQVFTPDEVAHYAPIPDPDMVFAGMSWVSPVFADVRGDQLQNEHKRAFLRNAATPNLAIKFDPSTTVAKVREFKQLMEEEHAGALNAYKTLFLGGGADPVVLGHSFREIDFAVTQGKAESRLAAAAGVPPSWVGFSEGLQGSSLNAGNFTAARRRFGDGTMQHLWSNVSTSLESLVTPPPQAQLWFATRGIPFLRMDALDAAEVQAREAQTIVSLVRDGGFKWETAVQAVQNSDWSLLDHTGLISVQQQLPIGQASNGSPNGQPATAPSGGSQT